MGKLEDTGIIDCEPGGYFVGSRRSFPSEHDFVEAVYEYCERHLDGDRLDDPVVRPQWAWIPGEYRASYWAHRRVRERLERVAAGWMRWCVCQGGVESSQEGRDPPHWHVAYGPGKGCAAVWVLEA